MKRVVRIGIIGQSERLFEVISDYAREVAYKLGLLIAKEGWVLFSGGRDGIMEEASRGAKDGKGVTVGILPGINIEEANKYIESALKLADENDKGVIYEHQGDILVKLKKKDEATEAYEKAIQYGEDKERIQPKIDALKK